MTACSKASRVGPLVVAVLFLSNLSTGHSAPAGLRGIESGGVYSPPLTLEFLEEDDARHFELILDGVPVEAGTVVAEEGEHVVQVKQRAIVDPPGRTSPVRFTIDKTPPTILFERPDWLPAGALPRVRVRDEHPDPRSLRLTLDGRPYDHRQGLEPGAHLFSATVADRAGNSSSYSELVRSELCAPTTHVDHVPPTSILAAAFYFPWYAGSAECPAGSWWCHCVWGPKPGNPRPALGFYNSFDGAVVNAQMDQLARHGVDVVAVEWYGFGSDVDTNFASRILPALATRRKLRFALLYDTNIRLAEGQSAINFDDQSIRSSFVSDFGRLAATYFKNPRQLRFNDRPVVYVYVTRAIVGSEANVRSAFDAIQQSARDNGFPGLYLVADHLWWHPDYPTLGLMTPRAASAFAPVDRFQGVPTGGGPPSPVRAWADRMANQLYGPSLEPLADLGLVDLTPGIFVQYDDSGLESAACGSRPVTQSYRLGGGGDWSYMIQTAGLDRARVAEGVQIATDCSETRTTNTDYVGLVWTYSFNEWGEGSGMERLDPRTPAYPFGFGVEPLQILNQKLAGWKSQVPEPSSGPGAGGTANAWPEAPGDSRARPVPTPAPAATPLPWGGPHGKALDNLALIRRLEKESGRRTILVSIAGPGVTQAGTVAPGSAWAYVFAEWQGPGVRYFQWNVYWDGRVTVGGPYPGITKFDVTAVEGACRMDSDEAVRRGRSYGGQRFIDRYPNATVRMSCRWQGRLPTWQLRFLKLPSEGGPPCELGPIYLNAETGELLGRDLTCLDTLSRAD